MRFLASASLPIRIPSTPALSKKLPMEWLSGLTACWPWRLQCWSSLLRFQVGWACQLLPGSSGSCCCAGRGSWNCCCGCVSWEVSPISFHAINGVPNPVCLHCNEAAVWQGREEVMEGEFRKHQNPGFRDSQLRKTLPGRGKSWFHRVFDKTQPVSWACLSLLPDWPVKCVPLTKSLMVTFFWGGGGRVGGSGQVNPWSPKSTGQSVAKYCF